MTRLRMLALAVLAGLAVTTAAAGTGSAQTAAAPAPTPTLVPITLTSVTPVVRPGGTLDVVVAVPTTPQTDRLEVAFRVGPAVTSRDAFAQAADGKSSTTALSFTTEPLVPGPATSTASTSLDVLASGRSTSDRVVLAKPGVYPLTITVRDADSSEERSSLVTFVVRADASAPKSPLLFSWVWPMYSPPPAEPDSAAAGESRAGASDLVAGFAAAAAATPVPVTLWPVPATLDAVRLAGTDRLDASTTLELLSQATAGRDVLGGAYALVATDGWQAIPNDVVPQYEAGSAALEDTLPSIRPTRSVSIAVGPRATAPDLSVLAGMGASAIVVDPSMVADPRRKTTLTQTFGVEGVADTEFARADPGLRDDLASGGGPAAAAQRLLADLFILQQDAPAETRGAVLVPDPEWRPSAALLAETASRIQVADFVTPVGLSTFFQRVPAARDGDKDLTLPTASSDPVPLPEAAGQYAILGSTRPALEALESMVATGQAPPPRVLEDAKRAYLIGADATLVAAGATASYAALVEGAYASVVGGIDAPPDVSITLTSATARVPITLRNDNPFPVAVALDLVPESAVSTERAGGIVVLEASRSHTEEFPVETAGSGTFRVLVLVSPPNGGDPFREIRVELTAAGGRWVATALTIGSLAFLGLWWLWHIRSRSRRGKHTRGRGEHPAGSHRPDAAGPPPLPDDAPGRQRVTVPTRGQAPT